MAFDTDSEAPELFAAAGCAVAADGVVNFNRETVKGALASVARQTRLWDRDGANHLELDNRHTWFMPGMTCIKVFDLASGDLIVLGSYPIYFVLSPELMKLLLRGSVRPIRA